MTGFHGGFGDPWRPQRVAKGHLDLNRVLPSGRLAAGWSRETEPAMNLDGPLWSGEFRQPDASFRFHGVNLERQVEANQMGKR